MFNTLTTRGHLRNLTKNANFAIGNLIFILKVLLQINSLLASTNENVSENAKHEITRSRRHNKRCQRRNNSLVVNVLTKTYRT